MKTFCCALFVSAAFVSTQAPPAGYASWLRALPPTAAAVAVVPGPGGASRVWFDGTDLVLDDATGQRSLLTFATPVFGAFTLPVGNGAVLFGESSGGGIWLVPLNGPAPLQPLATIVLPYDAAMLTGTLAVVSAKTSGFPGQDNDLLGLDLTTGAVTPLARIPGSSGPVAVSSAGDLYYATASLAFPAPPGQTALLRFRRGVLLHALATHRVLGPGHAAIVMTGIDSASDLAFDDDHDVLFVDWYQGAIGEIDDADGATPTRKTLISYPALQPSAVGVQFVAAAGPGVFEPFQPAAGQLHVHESDYAGTSRLRSVLAAPASLASTSASPIPAGAFILVVAHGPANGAGLIAIGLPHPPAPIAIAVPGFEQPLQWEASLLAPANAHFVTFDASGTAILSLSNPGFSPALAVLAQAAFVSATGGVIGATTPFQVLLGP
ncbi:MAG: hypothetical protein U1E73_07965 [Planctomycetota bacterium]